MLVVVTAEMPVAPSGTPPSDDNLALRLGALLCNLSLADAPRDGDCLVVAARVTAAVRALGIPADTVTVSGWHDHKTLASLFPDFGLMPDIRDRRILGFGHRATVAGRWILDATARQWHPGLPERWLVPLDEYRECLAAVMGVATVTLELDATGKTVVVASGKGEDRVATAAADPRCSTGPA